MALCGDYIIERLGRMPFNFEAPMYRLNCILCQILAFGILSLILATPTPARADDAFVGCAAIFACDSDGNVLPGFDAGPCAALYKSQCDNFQVNRLTENFAKCEAGSKDLAKQVRKLERKTRALERKEQRVGKL